MQKSELKFRKRLEELNIELNTCQDISLIFNELNLLSIDYQKLIMDKKYFNQYYILFYRAKMINNEFEEAQVFFNALTNEDHLKSKVVGFINLCYIAIEKNNVLDFETLIVNLSKFLAKYDSELETYYKLGIYFQLANICYKIQDYKRSISNYNVSLNLISEENWQHKLMILLNISDCFLKQKKYNECKIHLIQIIHLIRKHKSNKTPIYQEYLNIKYQYYEKILSYKKAYLSYKMYSTYLNKKTTDLNVEEIKKHEHNIINEKLKYENQLLTQRSETKDKLLSQLSHEIRTPLSIILGNTKQLVSEIDNIKSIEKVKSIHRNSLNLINQIDAVLEYNKLESGVQNNVLTDCTIISMIKNCIQDFSILTQSKSIEVKLTANIKEATIQIDTEKLQKILNNLLSNATKYNVEHGQIWVDLKWTKTNLQIEIKDTGIGIAAEHLPLLFDKYYQVQQDKFVEGFGIGLNVVHSLLKTMQGDIKVESTVNQGSSFTLSIPITSSNQVEKGKTEFINKYSPDSDEPRLAKTISLNQEKPSILLVEDNRELRQFIKGFLTADYNCIEAADGEEAYSLVLEHDPDIIVSDYMMPRMDGIELLEKLRENPETNHHSFVMLTADNLEKTKLNIIKKGADAFITKPFNEEELSSILHNIIQKQVALRSRFNSQSLSNTSPKKLVSKNEQFIHELNIILENQFSNEDLNVDMLCELTHLSKATLQRKTKSILKESPVEVMTNFRLQKAKTLIENNTANINEIAYQCGFNSPQYFSRVFKEKYGMSPRSMIAR